jgi:hypothetical protein
MPAGATLQGSAGSAWTKARARVTGYQMTFKLDCQTQRQKLNLSLSPWDAEGYRAIG